MDGWSGGGGQLWRRRKGDWGLVGSVCCGVWGGVGVRSFGGGSRLPPDRLGLGPPAAVFGYDTPSQDDGDAAMDMFTSLRCIPRRVVLLCVHIIGESYPRPIFFRKTEIR